MYNLKKLTIISILIIFFSCKNKKVIYEFTEEDTYIIINKHFIKQLNRYDSDSVIYWNNRQLKSPLFENTNIDEDEIPMFLYVIQPYPIFTSQFWKTDKIEGIKVMESKEYDYYFRKNDSINLEELWNSKFKGRYIHNVSYPIYNPKTNIAVIKDYIYRPFLTCGTDLDKLYYFKKTEDGWEILK